MADKRTIAPGTLATQTLLSAADYAELMQELDEMRSRHRGELAQELRDAREYGSPGDHDDRLAVFEDAAVDEARIAQLERLARSASVASHADPDGVAGLGSTVRVADEAGRTLEYKLVGRRSSYSTGREVSLASPVGMALAGARPGDATQVSLPRGRVRVLRVLEVTCKSLTWDHARPEAAVRAR